MPIYEYVCASCEHTFEQLIRSEREEKELPCPNCGKKQIQRQFSVIATPRAASKPAPGPAGCPTCPSNDGSCPFA